MSLLDRMEQTLSLAQQAKEADASRKLAHGLQQREAELREHRLRLAESALKRSALREAMLAVSTWPQTVERTKNRLQTLRKKLSQDVTALDDAYKDAVLELSKLANAAEDSVAEVLRKETLALKEALKTLDDVEHVPTVRNQIAKLKSAGNEAVASDWMGLSAAKLAAVLAKRADLLGKIADVTSKQLPASVRKFFAAVPKGASLALLTDEVRDWLRKNNQEDSLVVQRKQ